MGSDIRLNFDSITDSLDTYAAIESKNREIDQMNLLLASAQNELDKINRLFKRPYFGKLSLRFVDETEEDAFYIGVNGFTDEKKESLIYDWRSPIAAVFYENHQGLTAYQVNGETIAVHVAHRRQFMIEEDHLEKIIDTSIGLQDEFLLATLASVNTQEMSAITASIQTEQNEIIRDTKHHNILVHGVAGSGKTSVAMQRISFLLYHYRQQLTSDDVMILSPITGFTQYIAQVLPSLGEKNPRTLTLTQLIGSLAESFKTTEIQTFSTMFAKPTKEKQVLRQSPFVAFLKEIASVPAKKISLPFKPIDYKGKEIISIETMETLYKSTPETATIQERLQGVKQRLHAQWYRRLESNAKNSKILSQVLSLTEAQQQQMFGHLLPDEQTKTIEQAALSLLKRKYASVSSAIEKMRWVNQQTFTADLFQQFSGDSFSGKPSESDIDYQVLDLIIQQLFIQKMDVPDLTYLFIDEAQDYTPAQIELLLLLFPKTAFTLIGDENQSIFETTISFEEIEALFSQADSPIFRYDLTKSYRSSGTITAIFATLQAKNSQKSITAIRPCGQEIVYIEHIADEQLLSHLAESPFDLTVLTKSQTEATRLAAELSTSALHPIITVLPVHLAKGLEYPHVLLYNVNNANYQSELDQRVLYTAISRATETLTITSKEALSDLVMFAKKKPQRLLRFFE
ncbi:HelD family protein [Enterococcus sp. N342-3-1-2]